VAAFDRAYDPDLKPFQQAPDRPPEIGRPVGLGEERGILAYAFDAMDGEIKRLRARSALIAFVGSETPSSWEEGGVSLF
jgi:hypothetical protein